MCCILSNCVTLNMLLHVVKCGRRCHSCAGTPVRGTARVVQDRGWPLPPDAHHKLLGAAASVSWHAAVLSSA